MRPQDVEAIWSAVVGFYEAGLHPALGLCIRRRGEVILDRTIGHARGNSPKDHEDSELVTATPDTPFSFFSGSKVVTATLVHLLADRGKLDVDDPVATYIPEFARRQPIALKSKQRRATATPARGGATSSSPRFVSTQTWITRWATHFER